MSTPERDPFDLLPRFVDPEPDPVVMQAVIAQSRAAFAQRQAHAVGRGGLLGGLRHRRGILYNWLALVGIGAFAIVVALVVVPGLMQIPPSARSADQSIAEAPSAVSRGEPAPVGDLEQPSRSGGIRMGARPMPGGKSINLAPAPLSIVDGDGVRLGYRTTSAELQIYRLDGAGEQLVDSQPLISGEQSDVLGAFVVTPPRAQEVLVVQIGGDSAVFWRVYSFTNGAYARDPDLSDLVVDAQDQAEVERRLAEH